MTEPTTGPRVPRSLVEGVLGEQAARHVEKANELARKNAVSEARHKRVNETVTTVSHVAFSLAIIFGLAIGCLAIWNAVVG